MDKLRAFDALCDRRAARARALADVYPESAEALRFYGVIARFQKDAAPEKLLELVAAEGPALLRQLAGELDGGRCRGAAEAYASGADRSSPTSFFGRALLQAEIAGDPEACPVREDAPQVGCIVPEGDGSSLVLACSLCFHEWRHPKARCPRCPAEELVHYHAPELDHVELRACEACHTYLNVVRKLDAPDAVPDVDEIAALPLDVWATERGYAKLVRNLIGV